MSGTSGESINKGEYQKAEQIDKLSGYITQTSQGTTDSLTTQVSQTGVNIQVRIVPQPPRLGKNQTKTG